MSLLTIVLTSAAVLTVAYFTYGRLLQRLLQVDPSRRTPAVELADNQDYVPLGRGALLSQHFSAIAAAGPVVGPILAGALFGWLPAMLWILLGAILVGGVHDFAALLASVRHRARSIAEIVREHNSHRAYILFLLFIWLALLYVIVAFTDITAASFVGTQTLENGAEVSGGGIATSSLLYLALPVVMALAMRYLRMNIAVATAIFLPLVAVSIWGGQKIPLDVAGWVSGIEWFQRWGTPNAAAQRVWCILLLIYCFIASLTPMWLLLQPRGHLGGCFLFASLIGGGLGLLISNESVRYPALLFITVACGACSGFHSMVASGTTSKQLRTEADALPIAYGGMLLEAMVSIVSLCCVMVLARDAALITGGGRGPQPNLLYAQGIGRFLQTLGVPAAFAVSFALLAFTTFVYDTLDVCTRLGRYVIQELTGLRGRTGQWVATAVTIGVPLYFLLSAPVDATGKAIPTWRVFWNLFGASNQLLAALTLGGVASWLWQTRRALWVLPVIGLPGAWMYAVSGAELLRIARAGLGSGLTSDPVPWVAVVLLALAAMMLIEAALSIRATAGRPRPAYAT
jgi:carbon starvation protein